MRQDSRDRVGRSGHIPCSMGIQSTPFHGLQEAVERYLVESNPPLVERQSKPKPALVERQSDSKPMTMTKPYAMGQRESFGAFAPNHHRLALVVYFAVGFVEALPFAFSLALRLDLVLDRDCSIAFLYLTTFYNRHKDLVVASYSPFVETSSTDSIPQVVVSQSESVQVEAVEVPI